MMRNSENYTMRPNGKVPLFTYGMLLVSYFRQRSGAKLIGPAKLIGYELLLDGFATVMPNPDEIVYGAIIEVDLAGLRMLDRIEGVVGDPRDGRDGLYRRSAAVCELVKENRPVIAEVYIKNRVDLENPAAPSRYYLDTMFRGYEELGLPLASLEEVISAHSFAEFE